MNYITYDNGIHILHHLLHGVLEEQLRVGLPAVKVVHFHGLPIYHDEPGIILLSLTYLWPKRIYQTETNNEHVPSLLSLLSGGTSKVHYDVLNSNYALHNTNDFF